MRRRRRRRTREKKIKQENNIEEERKKQKDTKKKKQDLKPFRNNKHSEALLTTITRLHGINLPSPGELN